MRELGESMTGIAKRLGISQPVVGYAVDRGRAYCESEQYGFECGSFLVSHGRPLSQLTGIRHSRIMLFMEFIESSVFTKLIPKYLTDDEYRLFQWYLFMNPEAGDIVRGSGGVRKVR